MSLNNPTPESEAKPHTGDFTPQAVDLTKVSTRDERKPSILPPALMAAKAMNKRNSIGDIEVVLPIMNVTVKCSAFANVDEATIKSISGSISSYNDANFQLLYRHSSFPEEAGINSFEDFKRKLSEADFRTLLYGIMKASLKNLEEQRFHCKNNTCPNPDENKIFPFTPSMKDIKINFQQDNYVSPSNDHTQDLFVAENDILKINYKFDSIESKVQIFRTKTNEEIRNNLVSYGSMIPKTELIITYIDSIEVKDGEDLFTISAPSDINLFIKSLNVSSREDIEKLNSLYVGHIDGWIPTFSTTIECPHCKQTQQWEDIDIYVEFFRKFTAIF